MKNQSDNLQASQKQPLIVDVQVDIADDECEEPPSSAQLRLWARAAYAECANSPAELSIRITDLDEMKILNESFRGKSGATNVLSFPVDASELPAPMETRLLGDVVICHPVVLEEAQSQAKDLTAHYSHMVTHGVLHLCGYDHQTDQQASEMESLETQILQGLGVANPYA